MNNTAKLRLVNQTLTHGRIPAGLRDLEQWVCWKLERRGDDPKPTKIPYDPATGRKARSNEPLTWGTLDEALRACRGGYDGIGFMFAGGHIGLDIDGCRDVATGEIDPAAVELMKQLATYFEVSPSGTGLHGIARGTLPGKGRRREVFGLKLEMYSELRYFTVTGEHVDGTPMDVCAGGDAWILLYEEMAPPQSSERGGRVALDHQQPDEMVTDARLLELAGKSRNGAKFLRLWGGDTADYGGDESRADAALAQMLCFWTSDDAQVERLMKASKLYRQKFERADYLPRTIAAARAIQTNHYSPRLAAPVGNGSQSDPLDDVAPLPAQAEACERTAAAMTDSIMLTGVELGLNEEAIYTLLALFSIFGGRRTARVSGLALAARIRRLEETSPQTVATERQFGRRRLINLKAALKAKINYPILTLRQQGGNRTSRSKKTGKPLPSRWELDMRPFVEAWSLAEEFLSEWRAGHPRFEEWRDRNGDALPTHPGRARQRAAHEIAARYGKDATLARAAPRAQPDDFARWVRAEYRIKKAMFEIADVLEDLGKGRAAKRIYAHQLAGEMAEILLQDERRIRRRKLQQLQRLIKGQPEGLTVMGVAGEQVASALGEKPLQDLAPELPFDTPAAWSPTLTGAAIWRAKDADYPVVVERWVEYKGEWFALVAGSSSGIPAAEIEFLPAGLGRAEADAVYGLSAGR